MTIVCISDTHGRHREVTLPDGDLLIHAGDISNGQQRQVTDFLDWFTAHPHRHKIFIGGNMDYPLEKKPQHYRNLLPENVYYLENEGVEIEDIKIWGSPAIPQFVGAFNYRRGPELRHFWQQIPEDIDLLITHTPPRGILDRTSQGKSVGCKELLLRVQAIRPKVHLFGHVHESYGKKTSEHTLFLNASYLGGKPGHPHSPMEVNIEA